MSLFHACRCGHPNQVSSSFEDDDSELINSEDFSQQDSVAMKKMKNLETNDKVKIIGGLIKGFMAVTS